MSKTKDNSFFNNGIMSFRMVGTSSELHYTFLAGYEKRTGFDE